MEHTTYTGNAESPFRQSGEQILNLFMSLNKQKPCIWQTGMYFFVCLFVFLGGSLSVFLFGKLVPIFTSELSIYSGFLVFLLYQC